SESDQSEVGAIEHQLQAEQNRERVAPGQDAAGAHAEHDRGHGQIPADRHHHPPLGPASPTGATSGTSGSSPPAGRTPAPSAIVPAWGGRGALILTWGAGVSVSSSPRRRRAS